MQITLTPLRHATPLTLERAGDTLVLNGTPFDFTPLGDGQTLPVEAIDSPWFAGPVSREDGRLSLALFLPHGANAPEESRFPAPLSLDADGPVALPAYDGPEAQA